MLWSELHGAGLHRPERRADLVAEAESQATLVAGILCTDSCGGYDAVEVNESPLLGLSNMRAALQAFQLRDNLKRVNCDLRWVASDYDLADAFTKKRGDSRIGLLKFLKTRHWAVSYDPNFVAAKRNKKSGKTAIQQVDDALGDTAVPLTAHGVFDDFSEHALAIIAGDLYHQDQLHDLAIIAGAHAVHDLQFLAISAGSSHVQIGTNVLAHQSTCKGSTVGHHLSPFCAGATDPSHACQVMTSCGCDTASRL